MNPTCPISGLGLTIRTPAHDRKGADWRLSQREKAADLRSMRALSNLRYENVAHRINARHGTNWSHRTIERLEDGAYVVTNMVMEAWSEACAYRPSIEQNTLSTRHG